MNIYDGPYQKHKDYIYLPQKCQETSSMALSKGPKDFQSQESSQIYRFLVETGKYEVLVDTHNPKA